MVAFIVNEIAIDLRCVLFATLGAAASEFLFTITLKLLEKFNFLSLVKPGMVFASVTAKSQVGSDVYYNEGRGTEDCR